MAFRRTVIYDKGGVPISGDRITYNNGAPTSVDGMPITYSLSGEPIIHYPRLCPSWTNASTTNYSTQFSSKKIVESSYEKRRCEAEAEKRRREAEAVEKQLEGERSQKLLFKLMEEKRRKKAEEIKKKEDDAWVRAAKMLWAIITDICNDLDFWKKHTRNGHIDDYYFTEKTKKSHFYLPKGISKITHLASDIHATVTLTKGVCYDENIFNSIVQHAQYKYSPYLQYFHELFRGRDPHTTNKFYEILSKLNVSNLNSCYKTIRLLQKHFSTISYFTNISEYAWQFKGSLYEKSELDDISPEFWSVTKRKLEKY